MRRSKAWLSGFEGRMGLENKAEKIWFWCGFALLFIYLEAVTLGQNIAFFDVWPRRYLLLCALGAAVACFVGVALCGKIRFPAAAPAAAPRSGKKGLALAALVCLLTLAVLLIWQVAFWPGGLSDDSKSQFAQVLSGEYNAWHPVLHTWLFFWLPYQIFHQYWGIVFTQLLCFSLAMGYLFYVLYTTEAPWGFMIPAWLYIAANENTGAMLLYPWKDCAMTVFALVLFTQVIQIYLSDGAWLKKWRNVAAFAAIAFLTNAMRHNAVLLVAPVFIILFVFLKDARKKLAISAALAVAATLLLQGPVYALADVEEPGRRSTEMLGLPMTILTHVYVEDPEALSEEGRAFMDSLAEPDKLAESYVIGSFNSVKYIDGVPDKVEAEGAGKILRYTFQAACADPRGALQAFTHATYVVWSLDGTERGFYSFPEISENDFGLGYHGNTKALGELLIYYQSCQMYASKYLFGFPGVVILFLLFMAVAKLGGGNLSQVFMVLAPMAYNFGTMLLLSGAEFRFFYYNFVIVVPLLYIILQKKRLASDEKDL